MSKINVNGRSYSSNGNINIINGRVIIDGKDVTQEADNKIINIVVHGDITALRVDACEKIGVIGNCGDVSSTSGNIEVRGDVSGNVSTVSGNIKCGQVAGRVSTMSGNVSHK